MEGEGLCDCGYRSTQPEGPFCPKCASELYIRNPAAKHAPECKGLCECSYKSARPEGPFCPCCALRLFLRQPVPRPITGNTSKSEANLQTQHQVNQQDHDDISKGPAAAGVGEYQPIDTPDKLLNEEPNPNGELTGLIDDRKIPYVTVKLPGDDIPNQVPHGRLAAHSGDPSDEHGDRSRTVLHDDTSTKSTKKRRRDRSRSPRTRETGSEADGYRNRGRIHQRSEEDQHAPRAPLQELPSGVVRQRRIRHHNRGANKARLASTKENDEAVASLDVLPLPQSPPRAPSTPKYNENHPPDNSLSQQERLVTTVPSKLDSPAGDKQARPRPTPVPDNELHPPVDLLRLDADIQQLIDEERARVDDDLSRKTAGRSADESRESSTIDGVVPHGQGTSQ